jgi:putative transposase
MCLSILPKYSVSNVVGYLKWKSAISIARTLRGNKRIFVEKNFGLKAILYQQQGLMKIW